MLGATSRAGTCDSSGKSDLPHVLKWGSNSSIGSFMCYILSTIACLFVHCILEIVLRIKTSDYPFKLFLHRLTMLIRHGRFERSI